MSSHCQDRRAVRPQQNRKKNVVETKTSRSREVDENDENDENDMMKMMMMMMMMMKPTIPPVYSSTDASLRECLQKLPCVFPTIRCHLAKWFIIFSPTAGDSPYVSPPFGGKSVV